MYSIHAVKVKCLRRIDVPQQIFLSCELHSEQISNALVPPPAPSPSCLPMSISEDRENANVASKNVNISHYDVS